VEGKVEDTLPAHAPEQIALLRLDMDWYESTRHELVHLDPQLVRGGVLIIDDYGHWQGARKATDEYFQNNNICIPLNSTLAIVSRQEGGMFLTIDELCQSSCDRRRTSHAAPARSHHIGVTDPSIKN
jgi:Macrocin-O-methyltransferase (TylF)